jgi:hypothetical protein
MYVCRYLLLYVCMYVFTRVRMLVCVSVCMQACMCACVHVCPCVDVSSYAGNYAKAYLCTHVCMYVRMYIGCQHTFRVLINAAEFMSLWWILRACCRSMHPARARMLVCAMLGAYRECFGLRHDICIPRVLVRSVGCCRSPAAFCTACYAWGTNGSNQSLATYDAIVNAAACESAAYQESAFTCVVQLLRPRRLVPSHPGRPIPPHRLRIPARLPSSPKSPHVERRRYNPRLRARARLRRAANGAPATSGSMPAATSLTPWLSATPPARSATWAPAAPSALRPCRRLQRPCRRLSHQCRRAGRSFSRHNLCDIP